MNGELKKLNEFKGETWQREPFQSLNQKCLLPEWKIDQSMDLVYTAQFALRGALCADLRIYWYCSSNIYIYAKGSEFPGSVFIKNMQNNST